MSVQIPAVTTRDMDLWLERYAELLGCDPQPYAVSARIVELMEFRDAAVAKMAHLRARLAAAGASAEDHDPKQRVWR